MNDVYELARPEIGLGHNSQAAPMAELLAAETADLKKRADDLIAAGRRAVVTDRDTATKSTLLAGMMIDHGKAIDAARVKRKQPYLDAGRAVDAHFGQLRTELAGADPKKLGGEAARVKGLVDAFSAEEERKAEIERRRIEEEARRKEAEAAAARELREQAERQARDAALAGDIQAALSAAGPRIEAEVREHQLVEEARQLNIRALETRPGPIDTGLGVGAHRQSRYRAEITDLTAALRHARRVDEAAIRDVVLQIFNRQVRAGVRSLPGANVIEERSTIIRRA